MKRNTDYELIIETTEFPSLGIAHYEGTKVYVKGTIPEQKVLARVSKIKKDYIEAKLIKILENPKETITAKCPHFGICGGCIYQYVNYDRQLELKEREVIKLFSDACINNYEYLGIEKSPEENEYRNKMEYTFGDEEKGGQLTLGMHMKNKAFGVLTTDKCTIVDEDFRNILSTVLEYFKKNGCSYYKIIKHEGFLRNLVVRKAKNTQQILINLVTTSQNTLNAEEFKNLFLNLKLSGSLTGIIHTINDSLSDAVQPDKVNIIYGTPYIIEEISGLRFKISPFSFFQTNTKGAEKLYSIAMDFAGELKDKVVFDLYCGTGTIGQIAAKNAKKVIGIELIEEAVEAADKNAKMNGLTNCSFIAGDVAKVITTLNEKPDVIILDPPRPGVHPKALDYVIKFGAPEIVYVSCNPKSLVSDLKKLIASGYSVDKVKLMDMFPNTGNVECVTKLSLQKISVKNE